MSKEITLSVNKTMLIEKSDGKQIVDFEPVVFDLSKESDRNKLIVVVKYNAHSLNRWDGKRKAKSFAGVHGVGLDFDKGKLAFEEAQNRFSEYINIIYTTSSYTPENPKLRVLLPSGTLSDSDDALGFYQRCRSVFMGADSSCFESARMFYPCCNPGREHFRCEINTNGKFYELPADDPTIVTAKQRKDRRWLAEDTMIKLKDGSEVKFESIKSKVGCYCPEPSSHAGGDDKNPSAFCAISPESGRPFVSCSTCGVTFFCGQDLSPNPTVRTKDRKTPEAFQQAFNDLDLELRYNECNGETQIKAFTITGEDKYVQLVDGASAKIETILAGKGFNSRLIEKNVESVAYDNRFHPVKEYFTRLKYHAIADLAGYFEDEDEVFYFLLKRFLIGAVARVHERTQNFMLVLEGNQGIGKSNFVEWLGDPFDGYRRSGPILPENKDHSIARSENVIWEVSELGVTTRKSDREALKAFITEQIIKERRPYGKHTTNLHPSVSFIGTLNDEGGFLNDPTGNRRFNPVKLKKIDWTYKKSINVDDVWNEAYQLYQHGEPWSLTVAEEKIMKEVRKEHETPNALEDVILRQYAFDENDKESFVFSSDLRVSVIGTDYKYSTEDALNRQMSAACKKIGSTRIRRTNKHGKKEVAYLGLVSRVKLRQDKLRADARKKASDEGGLTNMTSNVSIEENSNIDSHGDTPIAVTPISSRGKSNTKKPLEKRKGVDGSKVSVSTHKQESSPKLKSKVTTDVTVKS